MPSTAEFEVPVDDVVRLHARLHIPDHALNGPGGLAVASSSSNNSEKEGEPAALAVLLICHGLLDTKYAPLFEHLQGSLPLATVAFDFRGNGLSTGTTTYGNYYAEADDIKHVVEYINDSASMAALTNSRPCRVQGIVGHSKGGSSMFLFAYKYPMLCPPLLVNISARFWLARETPRRWSPDQLAELQTAGRFLWRTYGGKRVSRDLSSLATAAAESVEADPGATTAIVPVREYWISSVDLQERCATDMSVVQALPHRCFILNIMGGADRVVPEDDVWEYDRLIRLASCNPKRTTTRVVPGATHFWSSPSELSAVENVLKHWLDWVLPLTRSVV
ncbi:hypothetical protein GGI07_002847 [Coemansia sp. Benny D115]|nr:hypothetical protein GGI07_002847 [Coemansia sp. Benny D115]